jgi:hypothetical protein
LPGLFVYGIAKLGIEESAETVQKSGQMMKIFLFTMAAIVAAGFALFLLVGEMFDWIQLFKEVFANKAKKH